MELRAPIQAAGNRQIADLALFDTDDPAVWEAAYSATMERKYAKNTRNFSRKIQGSAYLGPGDPPIYLIPRTRGGPSYKKHRLAGGVSADDLQYAPISKGYSMQNVSSFTLGPVVGEGLCLVNAAFSKMICVTHIEGGGRVDYTRRSFWRPAKTPDRKIKLVRNAFGREIVEMLVDGVRYDDPLGWLRDTEALWLDEWERWRKSVALSSRGDFHWSGGSPVAAYRAGGEYLEFPEWKLECYVKPSFRLTPWTDVYKFLRRVWGEERRPLGLVHPMASTEEVLEPATKEDLAYLVRSNTQMACQPYLVALMLLCKGPPL